jgi:hypothetical protein
VAYQSHVNGTSRPLSPPLLLHTWTPPFISLLWKKLNASILYSEGGWGLGLEGTLYLLCTPQKPPYGHCQVFFCYCAIITGSPHSLKLKPKCQFVSEYEKAWRRHMQACGDYLLYAEPTQLRPTQSLGKGIMNCPRTWNRLHTIFSQVQDDGWRWCLNRDRAFEMLPVANGLLRNHDSQFCPLNFITRTSMP